MKREPPRSLDGRVARFDEIMEALRALDKEINGDTYRRVLRRRQKTRARTSGCSARLCRSDQKRTNCGRPFGQGHLSDQLLNPNPERLVQKFTMELGIPNSKLHVFRSPSTGAASLQAIVELAPQQVLGQPKTPKRA
jgi:transcription initiation factor TFIIIB Brf1 subunit/transcription initiation factor TFIIB